MTTYDVHFQPVVRSNAMSAKAFTFGYASSLKVTGFQALVNRWVKTFLTPRGSDLLHPNEGTDFSNVIRSNAPAGSTSDVHDIAVIAIEDANDQVRSQDMQGMYSDEESLQEAKLVGFQASSVGDGVDLWVDIRNLAGTDLIIRLAELGTR